MVISRLAATARASLAVMIIIIIILKSYIALVSTNKVLKALSIHRKRGY